MLQTLSNLQGLRQYADNLDFQAKWQAVKVAAKEKAVTRIRELTGIAVRADALMDVQVCYLPDSLWQPSR